MAFLCSLLKSAEPSLSFSKFALSRQLPAECHMPWGGQVAGHESSAWGAQIWNHPPPWPPTQPSHLYFARGCNQWPSLKVWWRCFWNAWSRVPWFSCLEGIHLYIYIFYILYFIINIFIYYNLGFYFYSLNPAAAVDDMHTLASSGRFEPSSCIWKQEKLEVPCKNMADNTIKIPLTYINSTEPRWTQDAFNIFKSMESMTLRSALRPSPIISRLLLFKQRFSKFRKLSFICGLESYLWLSWERSWNSGFGIALDLLGSVGRFNPENRWT